MSGRDGHVFFDQLLAPKELQPFLGRPEITLHELLDGLYIARRRRDLLKETELYEATLRLYRSPETLLQLTGSDLKRE